MTPMECVVIFHSHKMGRKIEICVAFFLQILPNPHLIIPFMTPFSKLYFGYLVTMAQLVVRLPGRHNVVGSNLC